MNLESGISFFIPAYNCGSTIVESVESIMVGNFNHERDELIIVNDCSTDNTLSVLLELQKKYPTISVFTNNRNRGGAATRNIAIENTNHSLIFCLDSDNVLMPDSIPLLKKKLIMESADVAAFEELHYFKTIKTEITHKWKFDRVVWDIHYLLSHTQNPPASGNYMFTKQSWLNAGGYPEFANALDTWGFGVRQLFAKSKLVICEDTAYYHRYGHDSYWLRESRKGKTSLTALQVLIPYFEYIDEKSIDYIMSKANRLNWFDNIDNRPLLILDTKRESLYPNSNTFFDKVKDKIRAIINAG